MSSIKKALANFFETVAEGLNIKKTGIERIIDENEDYLEELEKTTVESREGIKALKEYAKSETPSLQDAINSLADTYETMEDKRLERVKRLKNEFIVPLKELLTGLEAREKEMKEAQKAEKNMNKLADKVKKQKSKPPEKQKPDKIADLELEFDEAKAIYEKEREEAEIAIESFNEEKINTMKSIINSITDVEKDYHSSVLSTIDMTKAKAKAINVQEVKKTKEKPQEQPPAPSA